MPQISMSWGVRKTGFQMPDVLGSGIALSRSSTAQGCCVPTWVSPPLCHLLATCLCRAPASSPEKQVKPALTPLHRGDDWVRESVCRRLHGPGARQMTRRYWHCSLLPASLAAGQEGALGFLLYARGWPGAVDTLVSKAGPRCPHGAPLAPNNFSRKDYTLKGGVSCRRASVLPWELLAVAPCISVSASQRRPDEARASLPPALRSAWLSGFTFSRQQVCTLCDRPRAVLC